jgi:hypothetical protein
MRINKLILIATILCFTTPASAWVRSCPTVAQINADLQIAATDDPSVKTTTRCADQSCTYEMDYAGGDNYSPWHLFMDFPANSDDEAQTIAQAALKSLVWKTGPIIETGEVSTCRYVSSSGIDVTVL